jgi:hypothetical protein
MMMTTKMTSMRKSMMRKMKTNSRLDFFVIGR